MKKYFSYLSILHIRVNDSKGTLTSTSDTHLAREIQRDCSGDFLARSNYLTRLPNRLCEDAGISGPKVEVGWGCVLHHPGSIP
jgi:hypothetical protein